MSTDWIKKWQENEIGFHQSKFHPLLEQYDSFKPGKILVPLCGKSLDMLYLRDKGHKVIGVELSPIACKDFFEENNITYQVKQVEEFEVFQSEKIDLWCGDFFKLPQSVWDQLTGLYDRASYIALPQELRIRYAEMVSKLSPKIFEMLLIIIEYPEGTIQGPPFSISEEEVKSVYSSFKVEKLKSDVSAVKDTQVTESVYRLSR